MTNGDWPATVPTLAEAEVFARAGFTDILYAADITEQKLARVVELHRVGCNLTVLLDNATQAEAVARVSRAAGTAIPAMIEIDSDGHRSGLTSDDPALVEVGQILQDGDAKLRGVFCHAGGSCGAVGRDAHAECAEQEGIAVVDAATALRRAGLPCQVVSVGSTPTAHAASGLGGVTKLRAEVYVLFDLVMAGFDVCTVDDIALSVLTTVIGHQSAPGWIICDAGWMAMSRDRGTAAQRAEYGYGIVCNEAGTRIFGLIMAQANQEHGVIASHPDYEGALTDFPVGTRLRILPNHACATASQHSLYHVVPEKPDVCLMQWPRFGG